MSELSISARKSLEARKRRVSESQGYGESDKKEESTASKVGEAVGRVARAVADSFSYEGRLSDKSKKAMKK